MREIKFRAWDGEGFYKWEHLRLVSPVEWGNDLILQQFTGLHDKNGKEIYEGDIMTQFWNPFNKPLEEIKEIGEVSITPDRGVLVGGKPIWLHDGAEVIGNIYENPELLNP